MVLGNDQRVILKSILTESPSLWAVNCETDNKFTPWISIEKPTTWQQWDGNAILRILAYKMPALCLLGSRVR